MGTWGLGNFESDLSLDVLDEVSGHLLDEIRRTFKNRADTIYEGMSDVITASVDILGTLASQYRYHSWATLDEISSWKAQYLQAYDHFVANNITEESREEQKDYFFKRRYVVVNTFDRLYQIIKSLKEE